MEKVLPDQFLRLIAIMNDLREKCPWDKKQTIHTLRQQTIEETYELIDAISEENWVGIKEELGDLLLHIVFYAKIADEKKLFNMYDVIKCVCEKLIARHPHIYGDTEAAKDIHTEEDVKRNWEKLKLKEGKKSVLSGVPVALPAMVKSMRLQEKAKQVGFEWDTKEEVWEKVQEEKEELLDAVAAEDIDKMEEELGDLFFSIVNYSRFLQIDAEKALERTNKKFIDRFTKMETIAMKNGKYLHEMSLEEMDAIWDKVKSDTK